MFPLHQSNELSFQICPNLHQHHTITQDLILKQHDHHHVSSNYSVVTTTPFQLTYKPEKSKTTTTASSSQGNFLVVTPKNETMQEISNNNSSCNNDNNNNNNNNVKRVLHREIERQRRKEMASLFSELRSRLPLDSLKGKRSMSDHMNEAVKYIKHLQHKVKTLNRKRDRLKKLTSFHHPETSARVRNSNIDVEVRKWCEGLEIVIRRCSIEQELPLSMVSELLIQEGLSIISCFYTQVMGTKLVYTIHCEPSENDECVDPIELHGKIGKLIQSSNLG